MSAARANGARTATGGTAEASPGWSDSAAKASAAAGNATAPQPESGRVAQGSCEAGSHRPTMASTVTAASATQPSTRSACCAPRLLTTQSSAPREVATASAAQRRPQSGSAAKTAPHTSPPSFARGASRRRSGTGTAQRRSASPRQTSARTVTRRRSSPARRASG
ncbi:MAG: hypothetical protein QM704_23275 [Anaeromyxobacteraceae bacterium]